MSFDAKRKQFTKEHFHLIEIDLDYCSLTSGVLPCTAAQTGNDKCFNTITSSNDIANYTKTVKTYRYCDADGRYPTGLVFGATDPDVIPSLLSVNISPAVIDIRGGLGVRSSVSLTFMDHPSSDINVDKYLDDRSWIAFERGTYWTKLRARNPNYQFRALRVLSGYLNDDGSFDAANFQTRHYVIEKMDVTRGQCQIVAKDPLKLASKKKAQVPKPSNGQLLSGLTSSTTSATLKPAGIGNSEYDASGTLVIDREVMTFTRAGDALTLVRGQRNTLGVSHSSDSTVQQCYVKNAQVNIIDKDMLENFAGIDASFIPASAWQAEADTFLSGLLDGIIVYPSDVWKELKLLSQDMPHYLWWDERSQEIQFTALKQPPSSANVLDMDSGLISKSVIVRDNPDMRVSSVFVHFGQFDPTKKIDDIDNFNQHYFRIDQDSIAAFGSSQIKTVFSRWISNSNKAAALQLAALYGRRLSSVPREISFSLEAKDADVWAGSSRDINHRDILDFSGVPIDTTFQITSVKESGVYNYQALEFSYGGALPEDEGGGDPDVDLIILGSNQNNINLRTVFNGLFPAPDATTKAKFVVETGVIIGGSTLGGFSAVTGSWPAGALVTLQINPGGVVVGRGGKGQYATGTPVAEDGSDAIDLSYALELINNGIIGGGGAGGDSDTLSGRNVDGGGGAGGDVGERGGGLSIGAGATLVIQASDGTTLAGGNRARIDFDDGGESFTVRSEAGADLGIDTTVASAGNAINKNGFTLTETVTGDIRGTVA